MQNAKALAHLLVRLHGMLLLFYTAFELTYFPFQIRMIQAAENMEPYHSQAMQDMGLFVLRLAVQALLAFTLFLKTEKVIDFLMSTFETQKTSENTNSNQPE